MKKLCIITPMFLPVPAVRGGAVEHLINVIIDQNELNDDIKIDLYTVYDNKIVSNHKNTKIIQIRLNVFMLIVQKCINKFLNIFKINKYYDFNFFKFKEIVKTVNKNDYDAVIIENNMQLYKYIYTNVKNKNIPFYFHLHNDLNPIDKSEKDYRFILDTSKGIFVISEYLKNKLNDICNTEKIKILYNVIDRKKYVNYSYDKKRLNELRTQLNISNSEIIVGYVGRPDADKGLLELIRSFNKIKKDNVRLLIISDDFINVKYKKEHTSNLIQAVSENSTRISISGRVNYEEMPMYYKLIDILVIPTICQEAFGMVALEGKTLNKKIIYTNSGALPEVLKDTDAVKVELNQRLIDNLSEALNNEIVNFMKRPEKKYDDVEFNDFKNYYDLFINYVLGDDEK